MPAKYTQQGAIVPLIISLLLASANGHYNADDVCTLAQKQNAFVDVSHNVTCRQRYLDGLPPAPNAFVPYTFCKAHFDGIELAQWGQPSSWLAPIVQFILPSFIFSMNIPRGQMFLPAKIIRTVETQAALRHNIWQACLVSFWHFILFLLIALDSLLWVFCILAFAGPMMASALQEAVLDHKIVRALHSPLFSRLAGPEELLEITDAGEDSSGVSNEVLRINSVANWRRIPANFRSYQRSPVQVTRNDRSDLKIFSLPLGTWSQHAQSCRPRRQQSNYLGYFYSVTSTPTSIPNTENLKEALYQLLVPELWTNVETVSIVSAWPKRLSVPPSVYR
jgi:hypothetical protein